MRRLAAVALVISFLGLGSGTLRAAHEFAHDCHHAAADAALDPAHLPAHPDDHHPHDESTCELHAVLNAPIVLAQAPRLLVQPGVAVGFQPLPAVPVQRLRLPTRIDCRGPPAFLP